MGNKKLFQKFTGWWKQIYDITKQDGNPATDEQPPYTHCLNCGAELSGMYCHKCGQQASMPIPKMWGFVKEYIKSVTCIDRQALPTLLNLIFHPGRLVKDYCAGRYRSYSPPIQINFFILFVLIILFSTIGNDISIVDSFKELTSKELFITDCIAFETIWHYVVNILNEDHICLLLVEILDERTVTTWTEKKFAICRTEWCTVRVSREGIGRWFLLGIGDMELHA